MKSKITVILLMMPIVFLSQNCSKGIESGAVDGSSALPAVTQGTEENVWLNTSVSAQSGTFEASFKVTPLTNAQDSVIGFSKDPIQLAANLATAIRFGPDGMIDVRDGSNYSSAAQVAYYANQVFSFRMVVNIRNHTYSVFVTPPGQSELSLASNYMFRTEQNTVAQLGNIAAYSFDGSLAISNVVINPVSVVVVPTPTPTNDYPNASNTGVPNGVTLTASGDMSVNTAGAVVDAMDISGTLVINANNVTVKRSRIRSSGYWAVRVMNGIRGTIIEDSDIDAMAAGGQGIYIGSSIDTIIRRNDISRGTDAVDVTGSTGALVEGNYMHTFIANIADPHYDGIQADGNVTGLVIRGNTINVDNTQTSAIMIDNYWGGSSNILVENNLLIGAGYTVYCDGNFNNGALTNVRFLNNRFQKGYWGYALIRQCSSTFTGNVDHATGAAISN